MSPQGCMHEEYKLLSLVYAAIKTALAPFMIHCFCVDLNRIDSHNNDQISDGLG
jgi:hypothetical protein